MVEPSGYEPEREAMESLTEWAGREETLGFVGNHNLGAADEAERQRLVGAAKQLQIALGKLQRMAVIGYTQEEEQASVEELAEEQEPQEPTLTDRIVTFIQEQTDRSVLHAKEIESFFDSEIKGMDVFLSSFGFDINVPETLLSQLTRQRVLFRVSGSPYYGVSLDPVFIADDDEELEDWVWSYEVPAELTEREQLLLESATSVSTRKSGKLRSILQMSSYKYARYLPEMQRRIVMSLLAQGRRTCWTESGVGTLRYIELVDVQTAAD